jgi:hypothetical protein
VAIIVFLNEEDNTITVVDGRSVDILRWSDLNEVAEKLIGREVYYVTSAEFVSGQSVVDLIGEVTGHSYDPNTVISTKKYIRSNGLGKLICRGPAGEIIFENKYDIKPLDALPFNILETNQNLAKCVELGKVEIIDEKRKKQLQHEAAARPKPKNARDQGLDSILVKTSVDEFLSRGSSSDIQEIDVSSQKSFKKSEEQETFKNLKSLGIDSGSE